MPRYEYSYEYDCFAQIVTCVILGVGIGLAIVLKIKRQLSNEWIVLCLFVALALAWLAFISFHPALNPDRYPTSHNLAWDYGRVWRENTEHLCLLDPRRFRPIAHFWNRLVGPEYRVLEIY